MIRKSLKIFFQILSIAIFVFSFFYVANGQYQQNNSVQNQNSGTDFLVDWTTDSYSPIDYEGRTLPGYGSAITLSATPLSPINENNYEYSWLIDSGFTPSNNGKSVANFTVRKNTGGEHTVLLTIRDKKSKGIIKEFVLVIPITNPEVIVYKEESSGSLTPLTIPLNLGNFTRAGSQLNLIAKPFSFNKIKDSQLLKYDWELNGKKVDISEATDNLSIDFPKEITAGTLYSLKLAVENPLDAFQFDEKNYKITVR